jgi:hypothetical protein
VVAVELVGGWTTWVAVVLGLGLRGRVWLGAPVTGEEVDGAAV